MALDGHEELMLDMRQARRVGLVLAPALETPQRDPERQQILAVLPGWLSQDATSITVLGGLDPLVAAGWLPD